MDDYLKNNLKNLLNRPVGGVDTTRLTGQQISDAIDQTDNGDIQHVIPRVVEWLQTKKRGLETRKTLGLWVEVTGIAIFNAQNFIKSIQSEMNNRQTQVEERQTDIENRWDTVVSEATYDSEVKDARYSPVFKKAFPTLTDRITNLEMMQAKYTPSGYSVTINHNLGRMPKVKVKYYEYAIGTEPNGLGTAPDGRLGAHNIKFVPAEVNHISTSACTVTMPFSYKLNTTHAVQHKDGNWYLIDGYKTIKIILS